MSQVATPTEPGWRPDPSGRYEWRYWDGGWTNRVANSEPTAAPEAAAAPLVAAPLVVSPPVAAPAQAPEAPAVDGTATTESTDPVPPGPRPSRDSVARAPFGEETTTTAPAPTAPTAPERRQRRTPWAVIVAFFRSFSDQPESYHSDLARDPLPADPRGKQMINAPGNYGHAGITALAALGIVAGAYLPWLSGTIGISHFARTGFDEGLGLGYSIGAAALAISALLSVRMRVFRWLTVVLSFVLAGFVVRDLLHTYDVMQQMNGTRGVSADVGWGLWMMIISAAIAMISSVRLSEDQKID